MSVEEQNMAEAKLRTYRCTVCGHIVQVEGELPEDFMCPVCGMGRDYFEEITE